MVKRILRYIAGTLHYGLQFTQSDNLGITTFCDGDWGVDLYERRSTMGFCIYLGSNLVNCGVKKQAVVARSSMEAEYWSLANTVAEIAWVQSLLSELAITAKQAPSIYCDNNSTVLLYANRILHSRTKNIELDSHFVREKVQQGQITVVHVPSNEQIAYVLTKPTSLSSFNINRTKLTVLPLPTLSLRGDERRSGVVR